jgi:hypothetical protein
MRSLGLWHKAKRRSNGPWSPFSFSSAIVTKGLRFHLSLGTSPFSLQNVLEILPSLHYFPLPSRSKGHPLRHIRYCIFNLLLLASSFPCVYSCILVPNNLHGVKPFLESHQFLSYLRISQHFMESEVSLTCSQEHTAGPYPEPHYYIPCLPQSYFSKIHFNIILSSTSKSS